MNASFMKNILDEKIGIEKLYVKAKSSLDRWHEPGIQSITVGRDGHGLLHLLLQKRLPGEQHDDAEDQEEDAKDGRGHAAVPRVLAVTASLRGLGAGRHLGDIASYNNAYIDKRF